MNTIRHRKTRYETAVPVNITLPPMLHKILIEIIEKRGFSGPSDYFQERIRLDGGLGLKAEGFGVKQQDEQAKAV